MRVTFILMCLSAFMGYSYAENENFKTWVDESSIAAKNKVVSYFKGKEEETFKSIDDVIGDKIDGLVEDAKNESIDKMEEFNKKTQEILDEQKKK